MVFLYAVLGMLCWGLAPLFGKLGLYKAFWTPWSAVSLNEARGRVCSETIACYPPGIPIICPGEVITGDIVDYLLIMKSTGAHFQGCHDPHLRTVRVIR